jgi:hypothetical protein
VQLPVAAGGLLMPLLVLLLTAGLASTISGCGGGDGAGGCERGHGWLLHSNQAELHSAGLPSTWRHWGQVSRRASTCVWVMFGVNAVWPAGSQERGRWWGRVRGSPKWLRSKSRPPSGCFVGHLAC